MAGSSHTLRKAQKLLIDSDMAEAAVAAQQLMQLSESHEDNTSEKSKEGIITSTWAMIEQIFGKKDQEEMKLYRPKKRRYRSLDSLYQATKPVPFDVYRTKKLRFC